MTEPMLQKAKQGSAPEVALLNVLRGSIETIVQALIEFHTHQPPVTEGLTDEVADLITATKRLKEIWYTDYD